MLKRNWWLLAFPLGLIGVLLHDALSILGIVGYLSGFSVALCVVFLARRRSFRKVR